MRRRRATAFLAGVVRAGLVLAGLVLAAVVVPLGVPAAWAAVCADPGQDFRPVPWPQRMLAPSRVWPMTRGGSVRVAVLDSGVDAAHPRLRGRVEAGFDAVTNTAGTGNTDCLGSGTQVAGVIVAQPADGVGFTGLAPSSTIVPVRVVQERVPLGGPVADAATLARAIAFAVSADVDIIVASTPSYVDDPALRAAVASALAAQILVVAAVGDLGGSNAPNPTPYPAAYPGVLGVGAIGETGQRWPSSQFGSFVHLVAPGMDVVTVQRGSGLVPVSGTGVAAGFVGGTAALVRAQYRSLPVAGMAQRLLATATPPPGGVGGPQYGRGIVNPEAAVHETLHADGEPVRMPDVQHAPPPPPDRWAQPRRLALLGTGLALLLMIVVFTIAVAWPRARRRRWRPAVVTPPSQRLEPEEPGPPLMLFDSGGGAPGSSAARGR